MPEKVLFVDDEPHVLSSIRRQLGRRYEIHIATGGPEALSVLADSGPFAAIVCDMRMPGMSGAEVLREVANQYPSTTRMILSGQADLDSTIAAVNEGHIFRFVTKPADVDTLRRHVDAAVEQYRLITTREELLERTLQSLVETLNDILGLTNPMARQRSLRVMHYVQSIAEAMHFEMPWTLRLAALLSQVGCVNLPPEILDKVYRSQALSEGERVRHDEHPQLAAQLIGRIPQMEPVADMIASQQRLDPTSLDPDIDTWDTTTLSTVVLSAAIALDESMAIGYDPTEALERLSEHLPGLPEAIMQALRALHDRTAGMMVHFVPSSALTLGMVLDQDLLSTDGDILVARGDEVTPSHLAKVKAEALGAQNQQIDRRNTSLRVLIPA